MGQSTDAYLFYGITVEEEMGSEEVAELLGLEIDNALPEGLGFDTHCHCEYPMPFIYVEFYKAWRGSPEKIDSLPEIDAALHAKLCEYAEKLGWDPPGWYLASNWC